MLAFSLSLALAQPAPASPRATYLALAERGIVQQSASWRTGPYHWFCEVLRCPGSYPLLTVWGVVRMFESVDAAQLAAPSGGHRAAVERLAGQVEQLFWNHYLRGFAPYPGDDFPGAQAWFDDNGWLGLAFVDAFRATGDRRWLGDAQRALNFIADHGWDGMRGMWWNTQHEHHSGEALAADSLLAMMLYAQAHNAANLARARRWIDWANAHDVGSQGLYESQGPGSTVIDYVQAPLIDGQYLLCSATGVTRYCDIAAAKALILTHIYGTRYSLAPVYDSIFFQWMMAYDRAIGQTHWIEVAQANATAAMQNATDQRGLWLGSWWGGPIMDRQTRPGMFRTMAGTTSLYAWLAYYAA
jgi:hypothetical protein